jgi:hypothetical protein
MSSGIPKDMNEILPVALRTDIAHTLRDSTRIETKLARTCRSQDVEKFIDFRRVHKSILSFRVTATIATLSVGREAAYNKTDRQLLFIRE